MVLNIGCSGCSYEGWKGNFYPRNVENKNYLLYNSKSFKFLEVHFTYYHILTGATVRGWKDKTSEGFKFSLRCPKVYNFMISI